MKDLLQLFRTLGEQNPQYKAFYFKKALAARRWSDKVVAKYIEMNYPTKVAG